MWTRSNSVKLRGVPHVGHERPVGVEVLHFVLQVAVTPDRGVHLGDVGRCALVCLPAIMGQFDLTEASRAQTG